MQTKVSWPAFGITDQCVSWWVQGWHDYFQITATRIQWQFTGPFQNLFETNVSKSACIGTDKLSCFWVTIRSDFSQTPSEQLEQSIRVISFLFCRYQGSNSRPHTCHAGAYATKLAPLICHGMFREYYLLLGCCAWTITFGHNWEGLKLLIDLF